MPTPGVYRTCTDLLVLLQPDAAPWAPSSSLANTSLTCCLFSHPLATGERLLWKAVLWSGLFCFGEEGGAGSLCFCCELLAEEAAFLLGHHALTHTVS